MQKKFYVHALLVGLSPFLIQCVAQERDVIGLDMRMRTLDARLIEMERDVQVLKNRSADQAELSKTIDVLSNRIQQLEGQVDERVQAGKKAQETTKGLEQTLTTRLGTLDNRVKELHGKLAQLAEQSDRSAKELQAIKDEKATEAAARAEAALKEAEAARDKAEKAASATTASPREIGPEQSKKKTEEKAAATTKTEPAADEKATGAGKELYDKGVALFKDKKYKEAYNRFADYLAKHPKGELAPNARFWLGDCLYQQKEYELAILEYQKVIAEFGQSAKAPAALLKQAMAFEELKEPETARIVYNKVLEDYPQSEQAEAAAKKLKALKK